MMGLNQGGSDYAITLDTLKDPTAYAEKLKKLNDLIDRAKLTLEQAKQENVSVVADRKKIEELNGSTLEALQKINDTKAEIVKKETDLAYRAAQLDTREGGLNAREASIAATEKEKRDQLDKDTADLQKWKAAHAAKVDADTEAIAKTLADKTMELEAQYKAKMDVVDKNYKAAEAAKNAADAAKAKADEAKATYDTKLAALRQAVG